MLSPERNSMPVKTTCTPPTSGLVVLFPDNETWMIFFKNCFIQTLSHCFYNILKMKDHLRNILEGINLF